MPASQPIEKIEISEIYARALANTLDFTQLDACLLDAYPHKRATYLSRLFLDESFQHLFHLFDEEDDENDDALAEKIRKKKASPEEQAQQEDERMAFKSVFKSIYVTRAVAGYIAGGHHDKVAGLLRYIDDFYYTVGASFENLLPRLEMMDFFGREVLCQYIMSRIGTDCNRTWEILYEMHDRSMAKSLAGFLQAESRPIHLMRGDYPRLFVSREQYLKERKIKSYANSSGENRLFDALDKKFEL